MLRTQTLTNCLHMAYAAHHPACVILHKLEHTNNPGLLALAEKAEEATKELCEALQQLAAK